MIRTQSSLSEGQRLRALYRRGLSGFFLLIFLLTLGNDLPAQGPAKELPVLVTVGDLAEKPGQYDGHRVVVTGRVRSMEMQLGRRGSEYLMIILEEDSPASSGKVKPVQVYIPTIPKVREGDRALVQGVYHIEGMQAGRSFEHFVDAEVVLRN